MVVSIKERELEKRFVVAIKKAGGICPKFVSPGFDGMPDRIVLLPGGRMAFAEVKAVGCKPRPLQEARHGMLRRLGFRVFVLDDVNNISPLIKTIRTGGDDE